MANRQEELHVVHSWYYDVSPRYNLTFKLKHPIILLDLYLEYLLHRYWLTTYASLSNYFRASRDRK